MSIKRILRKIMPKSIYYFLKGIKFSFPLIPWTCYWFYRDLRYSNLSLTREARLSSLLINGHVLEKGITMPERRKGFGQPLVKYIMKNIRKCISIYGNDYIEIQAALRDLKQYQEINGECISHLLNEEINSLMPYLQDKESENCFEQTSERYFTWHTFEELAHSRHSIRNFSNAPIKIELVTDAIRIAQTAPSACNRQSVRVKIISAPDKIEFIRHLQNGNRGFGHLADKFLLITVEQGAWDYQHHTSAFLDAGIFTMNLLYALHDKHIGACTLNAHFSRKQWNTLNETIGIPKSEIPIVFIAIGNIPEKFMLAKSQRLNTQDIVTVI